MNVHKSSRRCGDFLWQYFHRFLSIFWIFWHFLVTKKLITDYVSIFFHFQHTLNIFFNNCKGGRWGGSEFEKDFRKNSPQKVLLGLNLMSFTDLFYKDISYHFLQGRLFDSDFFTNRGPGSINTNWGPGPVNTNRRPGPANTNWGPEPKARAKAGGQATSRGPGNTNSQFEKLPWSVQKQPAEVFCKTRCF